MATNTLEQRVSALERQFAELAKLVHKQPARDAWRTVVGLFADDPDIGKLHKETQRIREKDRAKACRRVRPR